MSPTDIRALVDRYIDGYNRKNIDDMLAGVHPQVEFKNISAGVVNASTSGIAELEPLLSSRYRSSRNGINTLNPSSLKDQWRLPPPLRFAPFLPPICQTA